MLESLEFSNSAIKVLYDENKVSKQNHQSSYNVLTIHASLCNFSITHVLQYHKLPIAMLERSYDVL